MITTQKTPYASDDVDALLDPLIQAWMRQRFGDYALTQRYGVPLIHAGTNTLISAPTGSGKTLTAFLSTLNELLRLSKRDRLEDKIYCIYISPLKALNNDIKRNLEDPLKELETLAGHPLGIRVAVRTGDTSQSQRTKMLKTPPHILITTPESLAILLATTKFKHHLKDIRWVVVDEVHALAENKRGVQLSICLERLQNHAGRFTRVGLSATIAPLDVIAQWLVGYEQDTPRDCTVCNVDYAKKLDLTVVTPVEDITAATHEELEEGLYRTLHEHIESHTTTLVFTNTRSATERIVHGLTERHPDLYSGAIAAHHGSLSAAHRLRVEDRLKRGELKAVVCSTSLELGIDIGAIDLVVLVGSPKSVARLIQRVGRAGHRLHETAVGRIIATDRDDLVECAVMTRCALRGDIDTLHVPENALDVLAQQLYGIAIEGGQFVDNVYALITRSYCYRNLSRKDFDAVLGYLAGDYLELRDRHVYAKIWVSDDGQKMGKRGRQARVIYATNVSVIPDESYISVKLGQEKIGEVEEAFLERLKKGDVFVLGGTTYVYKYSRGQVAHVAAAHGRLPTVPSWYSEMLPLSYELAGEIRRFRGLMKERFESGTDRQALIGFIEEYLSCSPKTAQSIHQYFWEQHNYRHIPAKDELVVEYCRGFKKKYVIVHSLMGRRVNDALSRAIAYAAGKRQRRNVAVSLADQGFYLQSESGKINIPQALADLAASESLRGLLAHALDSSDVLVRRFRHCAARALMILRHYKGRTKTVGRQQVGSKILYSFVKRLDPDFPILREARREVLDDLMDVDHATFILEEITAGRITVSAIDTDVPTPFAQGLVSRAYMDVLRVEERREFIKRMQQSILMQIRSR